MMQNRIPKELNFLSATHSMTNAFSSIVPLLHKICAVNYHLLVLYLYFWCGITLGFLTSS